MKKIIKLTEHDLTELIKRVIKEQSVFDKAKQMVYGTPSTQQSTQRTPSGMDIMSQRQQMADAQKNVANVTYGTASTQRTPSGMDIMSQRQQMANAQSSGGIRTCAGGEKGTLKSLPNKIMQVIGDNGKPICNLKTQ